MIARQKKDKTCLTIGLCANMDDNTKLPSLVINSHFHECPNNVGIYWHSNKRALMNVVVFVNYMIKFDRMMMTLRPKKVVILLDNA